METRKITVSIPEDLLRQIKVVAARRDTSVSAILTRAMRQIANEEDGYAEANRGMLTPEKGLSARHSWQECLDAPRYAWSVKDSSTQTV
jgi:predicted transcriptional regulator